MDQSPQGLARMSMKYFFCVFFFELAGSVHRSQDVCA